MPNKEQIQRDMAIAFDFIEQIIEHPHQTDNIPDGAAISFLNQGIKKAEKRPELIIVLLIANPPPTYC